MLDCPSKVTSRWTAINEGVSAYTELAIEGTGNQVTKFEDFGVCRTYRPADS